METTISSQST
jgi:tryptophanyl-tRNA synthetase